jgi:hypothetical protein
MRRLKSSVGMTLVLALAGAGVLSLGGCAKPDPAAFDKSIHDSCLPSAVSHGAAPDVAERYCSCAVSELDKLPVSKRLSLGPSSPEVTNAMETCAQQVRAG